MNYFETGMSVIGIFTFLAGIQWEVDTDTFSDVRVRYRYRYR